MISLHVRAHSCMCTFSIMCLWLKIGGCGYKMVTLLLLVAFGQSIGQVGIVSDNTGQLLEEAMFSFISHAPVLHKWSESVGSWILSSCTPIQYIVYNIH